MWNRIDSDLSTICVAVRDKLLTDVDFSAVWISLDPFALRNPPDDQFAVVSLGDQILQQASTMGGGREYNFVEGVLTVTIYARLILDQVTRNDSYMTDASLGALKRLKCCINSLQMFDPVNGASDYVLAEPLRFFKIDTPKKVSLPGWGLVQGQWRLAWTIDLSC